MVSYSSKQKRLSIYKNLLKPIKRIKVQNNFLIAKKYIKVKKDFKNNNVTYTVCLIKTYFVRDKKRFNTLRKTFNLHLNPRSGYNTNIQMFITFFLN